MFGVHNNLRIVMCEDAEDAVKQGYNYTLPEYKAIRVNKVVVVRDGTVNKKPTVDFILEDEQGQKYVMMITGALLKSIPCGGE